VKQLATYYIQVDLPQILTCTSIWYVTGHPLDYKDFYGPVVAAVSSTELLSGQGMNSAMPSIPR
jgi:hypothetical protein